MERMFAQVPVTPLLPVASDNRSCAVYHRMIFDIFGDTPHIKSSLLQVQAYVAKTDIDPNAEISWLQVHGDEMQPSPQTGVSLRRVMSPFRLQFRHSKTSPSFLAATGGAMPGGGAASAGEDVRLNVPEIETVMDSREFEVLIEVLTKLLLAPVEFFHLPYPYYRFIG